MEKIDADCMRQHLPRRTDYKNIIFTIESLSQWATVVSQDPNGRKSPTF